MPAYALDQIADIIRNGVSLGVPQRAIRNGVTLWERVDLPPVFYSVPGGLYPAINSVASIPDDPIIDGYVISWTDKAVQTWVTDENDVVTGFDFSAGNAIRSASTAKQMVFHAYMWDRSMPLTAGQSGNDISDIFTIAGNDWQALYADYAQALPTGVTGWSNIHHIDWVNETASDSATEASLGGWDAETHYVMQGPQYLAAEADASWTYSPRLWPLAGLPAIIAVAPAHSKILFVDYSNIDGGHRMGWQSPITAPMVETGHFSQRLERNMQDIQDMLLINQEDSLGGRIDGFGMQAHLKPNVALFPDLIRWTLQRLNMLELGGKISELNVEIEALEDAGYTNGTEAANEYARAYTYEFCRHFYEHLDRDLFLGIQPWTDNTDQGDDTALSVWDDNGDESVLYPVLGDLISADIQVIPGARGAGKGVRATFVDLAKNIPEFRPYNMSGTIISQTPAGVRGTGLSLPWDHILRRVNGVVQEVSQDLWEVEFLYQRNGNTSQTGHILKMQDAGGADLIAFGYSGGQLSMTTSAGTVAMPVSIANGSYAKVVAKYDATAGQIMVTQSARSSSGTITNAASVATQTVTLAAPIETIAYAQNNDGGTWRIVYYGLYDTTDVSPDAAALIARAAIDESFGAAWTYVPPVPLVDQSAIYFDETDAPLGNVTSLTTRGSLALTFAEAITTYASAAMEADGLRLSGNTMRNSSAAGTYSKMTILIDVTRIDNPVTGAGELININPNGASAVRFWLRYSSSRFMLLGPNGVTLQYAPIGDNGDRQVIGAELDLIAGTMTSIDADGETQTAAVATGPIAITRVEMGKGCRALVHELSVILEA